MFEKKNFSGFAPLLVLFCALAAMGSVADFTLSLNFIEEGSPVLRETIELGMNSAATADFDSGLDLFLPPPMGVGYHFAHDTTEPFNRLVADYRNSSDIGAIWRVEKVGTSFGVNVVFGDTSAIFDEDSYTIYFKIIGILDPLPDRPFVDSSWLQLILQDTVNYNPTFEKVLFSVDSCTSVGIADDPRPRKITVLAPRPNPFNSSVRIPIFVGDGQRVSAEIVDLLGRRVRSMPNIVGSGRFDLFWDGRDDRGRSVAGGIYLCRIDSEDDTFYEKVLLVK